MKPNHIVGALALSAAFCAGYITNSVTNSESILPLQKQTDIQQDDSPYSLRGNTIYYKDGNINIERSITQRNNSIIVGTIYERIYDLLAEDPATVTQTTESILNNLE